MYPDVGTFVLIRPTQTFYERINVRHSVFGTYVGNLDIEVPMNVLGDMVAVSRPFVAKDEAAQ